MYKIEIMVLGEIEVGEKFPQVIVTSSPDMPQDKMERLFRKFADDIRDRKVNEVNADDLEALEQ